jgi:alkanesulfonate monooxygenase SsuD/methylene tetrahydromethanopterin reductase-like flavin-dependent oxidoreductase (luciferase family)
MYFGVFDQNERSGRPVAQQYRERLALLSLYEQSGFYCYHMSEHHGTPISTTPSPSVFLAAVSQVTKTLRFGPLVYLLPGYSPLRLAEEIAMLDNLSGGRFEFGVGRGASPYEMGYLGVPAEAMQPMYTEALDIIRNGLRDGVLDHQGQFWRYDGVELSLTPVQRPHPPMWVAVSSPDSAVWPARCGANIVVGAPAERARVIFQRYLDEAAASAPPRDRFPLIGLNRYVLVAETDAAAVALAARAWSVFYGHFIKLWRRYGGTPRIQMPEAFTDLRASGTAIVGSPETVRAVLAQQLEASGANFLSGTFVFGDMSDAEARRSIGLFAREVMPVLRKVGPVAHSQLLESVANTAVAASGGHHE